MSEEAKMTSAGLLHMKAKQFNETKGNPDSFFGCWTRMCGGQGENRTLVFDAMAKVLRLGDRVAKDLDECLGEDAARGFSLIQSGVLSRLAPSSMGGKTVIGTDALDNLWTAHILLSNGGADAVDIVELEKLRQRIDQLADQIQTSQLPKHHKAAFTKLCEDFQRTIDDVFLKGPDAMASGVPCALGAFAVAGVASASDHTEGSELYERFRSAAEGIVIDMLKAVDKTAPTAAAIIAITQALLPPGG